MMCKDVVIVGAGAAGLAAGLQLKRYGRDVMVLEAAHIGGLLHNANLVENYLGTGKAVGGVELAERMARQADEVGLEIRGEEVLEVKLGDDGWQVCSGAGEYKASAVVVASGTVAKGLEGVVVEDEVSEWVRYEVVELGDVSGGLIAIVGAGDAAFDYALNLAGRDNRVVIMNRGSEVRALRLLVERVGEDERIEYREGAAVKAVRVGKAKHVLVEWECGSEVGREEFDYVLGAIGREARLEFLAERWHSAGIDDETAGLFMAGDVVNGRYRQAAIAVGDGLRTAMKVQEFLQERRI
ncbi:MAG: NAD(P)/FAD-dependent oxidoreductase [Sedimentisphaerales bacterium]|nr:NAD(P)/FAD-dependent oxidoreductase [Sedimentisphaerales bacterium]